MDSLQMLIITFITTYIIAFIVYLFNKQLGLQFRNGLNGCVIAITIYLLICCIF